MGKFKVEVVKQKPKLVCRNKVHEVRITNNGSSWVCFDLSTIELRKLRRTITKYLKNLENENLQ